MLSREDAAASSCRGAATLPDGASRCPCPGFVNAHCHAFQRALRGRVEGGDFWALARDDARAGGGSDAGRGSSEYAAVYRELRAAGYTAVGEFHYLGLEEARAAAEAAAEAGIELVLLHVAYARGGIERFRQESVADYLRELEELRADGVRVGVAPHSVRACPRDWLEELGRYAAEHELPLHVHADEQPREIEECLAEHGLRPIELLAACGCLGPQTTVVHATHADGGELDLLGEAGARVCACPTTEANLADGFLPVERFSTVASASASAPTRTSASTRSRSCASSTASRAASPAGATSSRGRPLAIGSREGAAALAIEEWPAIEIDAAHPQLRGVDEPLQALVHGCSADVVVR